MRYWHHFYANIYAKSYAYKYKYSAIKHYIHHSVKLKKMRFLNIICLVLVQTASGYVVSKKTCRKCSQFLARYAITSRIPTLRNVIRGCKIIKEPCHHYFDCSVRNNCGLHSPMLIQSEEEYIEEYKRNIVELDDVITPILQAIDKNETIYFGPTEHTFAQ